LLELEELASLYTKGKTRRVSKPNNYENSNTLFWVVTPCGLADTTQKTDIDIFTAVGTSDRI
jgi:hypothetical protein